jgi:hypothetical protein
MINSGRDNAVDFNNALFPWEKKGNTLEEFKSVDGGGRHIHVSIGRSFPIPYCHRAVFQWMRSTGGMVTSSPAAPAAT